MRKEDNYLYSSEGRESKEFSFPVGKAARILLPQRKQDARGATNPRRFLLPRALLSHILAKREVAERGQLSSQPNAVQV